MSGTLGFCVGACGADHLVGYIAPYLGSALALGYTMPGTLGFYVGVWEADHPVGYTAPYLGSARRPRIHHAWDFRVLRGGLGSG